MKPGKDEIDPHSLRTDFVRKAFAVGAERCFRGRVGQRSSRRAAADAESMQI